MSDPVHATAVIFGATGVLICGASGAGKSSLALSLIEEGGRLIGDDRLMLSACNGRLVATALDAIAGQIELRGRGIINVPHEHGAVIGLVVDLVEEEGLDRMPEPHQLTTTLLGIALPRQPVAGRSAGALRLVHAAIVALKSQPEGGLRMAQV